MAIDLRAGGLKMKLCFPLSIVLCAFSSNAIAQENAIQGFGAAKFGMDVRSVLSVLDPTAKAEKNIKGDTIVTRKTNIKGVAFDVIYFFDRAGLYRVLLSSLITDKHSQGQCLENYRVVRNEIEARYGSFGDKSTESTNDGLVKVDTEKVTADNGAYVEVSYSVSGGKAFPSCGVTVRYVSGEKIDDQDRL